MTDYTKEYYYLERDGNPNYPLLEVDDDDYKSVITAKKMIIT